MRVKTSNTRREILLFPPSLEEKIDDDSIVRLIDVFVDHLDMGSHGFEIKHKDKHEAGAPQYAPSDLLKIYLYGYYNRTRSSRRLERCCRINIEVMWLINGLTPGYVTISNFRKHNPQAFKLVFRTYNRFLDSQGLFGKTTIAVDSSKFRAQNSKGNNISDRSIDRHQKYIDQKIQEYLTLLDQSDQMENSENIVNQLKEKIELQSKRKEKYDNLKAELDMVKAHGQKQISMVDRDSRLITSLGSKGIIGYNVQSTVDDKYYLIVDNEVTNEGDQNALHKMAYNAKEILNVDKINVLADSGYDTGEELMKCTRDGIITYVCPRHHGYSQKDDEFKKDKFSYNKCNDTYACPEGNTLETNGKWYTKKRKGKKDSKFKEYRIGYNKCFDCQFKDKCAGKRLNRNQGRVIERYEYDEYTEENRKRIKENKDYYRRRQAIVEHPFGTIKRNWGYTYTLVKGKEKVGGEFDLICLTYNIRRSVSVLNVRELIRAIKASQTVFNVTRWLFLSQFRLGEVSKMKIIDISDFSKHSMHYNKCA